MSKRATQQVNDYATRSGPPESLRTRSPSAPDSPKRASTRLPPDAADHISVQDGDHASARNQRLLSAHHDALLDACWDASVVHVATTMAQLLLHVANHVRQHPDFDALGLERVTRWLDDVRGGQPYNAELFVGRTAVNGLIDKLVDAFEAEDVHL
jgi:hypothetical protein